MCIRDSLWAVFNRVQENLVKGGLNGRTANGRNQRTRPVQGIDQNLRLKDVYKRQLVALAFPYVLPLFY